MAATTENGALIGQVEQGAESARVMAQRIGKEISDVPKDLKEPVLSPNSLKVLEKRYLAKNATGEVIETPQGLFWRVAWNIAAAEVCWGASQEEITSWAKDYYRMMASLDFLPNSPTLMNAGGKLGQLSACFVLSIDDDMSSIMEAAKQTALIHQSGGGTGFSFSRLRPEGDLVSRSGGEASGPVSFMKIFDQVTDVIKQGGRRRGANMGCLSVHHPDILEFVRAKQTPGELENFNLSVLMTDEFIRAVENEGEYELINPHTGQTRSVKAREVFDEIVKSAWASGEPGVIFIDRINAENPTRHLGKIESTNPCGEQPLHPYESCNLGSVNVAHMVENGQINEGRLRTIVRQAVRFMDDVIEINQYPLPEIEKMTLGNRRIGLGIMGLADMLIQMNLAYDSDEGIAAAAQVMEIIQEEGYAESEKLALQRGVFPNWEGSEHEKKGRRMRNATITTIAPTGSIGIITGDSQGCEPLFALWFKRKGLLDGKTDFTEDFNPLFLEAAKKAGLSEEILKKVAETGRVRGVEGVPEWLQKLFPTAYDISPEWHIRMQAALQQFTDNAVSKTINMSNSATAEDVARAYLMAYEYGCKGVTIYRDGSRKTQVLYAGQGKEDDGKKGGETVVFKRPEPRPKITTGKIEKVKLGCSRTMYITVAEADDSGPFEVFVQTGKSGGCTTSQLEAIGRLASLALRSGVDPEQIVRQLKGIRCPSPGWDEGKLILSCADAVAKAIERYLGLDKGHIPEPLVIDDPPGDELPPKVIVDIGHSPECPDCGAMLQLEEGCQVCRGCGFSRCG